MLSFKGLAAGLVALLSAEAVVASPCRVRLTTTSSHALSSSVPLDTETISSSIAQDLTTTTIETIFPTSTFSSEWSSVTELSTTESDVVSSTETEIAPGTGSGTETATGTSIWTVSASFTETASTVIESSGVTSITETATSNEATISTDGTTEVTSSVETTTEAATSTDTTAELTTSTDATTEVTTSADTTTEATTSADTTAEVTTSADATTEATTSADATTEATTSADATTTTEAMSSSTEIASTTAEAPALLPTIVNGGFDDNSNGSPWILSGPSTVNSATVYWKRSAPNIMLMRPDSSFAQPVTDLRTNVAYRIRFYWAKVDTPQATAGCKLTVTFGDRNLGEVAVLPPETAEGVWEGFLSPAFQPSATSADLKIGYTCTGSQNPKLIVDDVSIEFAR